MQVAHDAVASCVGARHRARASVQLERLSIIGAPCGALVLRWPDDAIAQVGCASTNVGNGADCYKANDANYVLMHSRGSRTVGAAGSDDDSVASNAKRRADNPTAPIRQLDAMA